MKMKGVGATKITLSLSCGLHPLRRQLDRAKVVTNRMLDIRVLWPQYQELVRNLHCQYQDAPAHAAIKARLHMDFTMLLLFAVTLGRGRELRTLCLLMEMPEGRVQTLARRRQCSSHLRQLPALAS